MKIRTILSQVFWMLFFYFMTALLPQSLLADDNSLSNYCIDKAIRRVIEIRSLPELGYLQTLDGQQVPIVELQSNCLKLFPYCSFFEKFYYWPSEIKEVVSKSINGMKAHQIRSYHSCLSEYCSPKYNSQKSYGDIAEFYDHNGKFMGLSVYIGNGKYCPIPFDGYQVKSNQ